VTTDQRPERPKSVPGLSAALVAGGYAHCFSTTEHEVGGVLVGEFADEGPPIVHSLIPARHAAEGASDLTFTQQSWEDIHARMDREFSGLTIVGWYHTHPGYGLFLSAQDQFIHENFFQNPSQIAVVIDPLAGEEAVYRWNGNTLVEHDRSPCAVRDPKALSARVRSTQAAQPRPDLVPLRAGPARPRSPRSVNRRPQQTPSQRSSRRSRARPASNGRSQVRSDPFGLGEHARPAVAVCVAVIVVSVAVILWALMLR
jgi:proteasome lid subunit RPN8/RPN11